MNYKIITISNKEYLVDNVQYDLPSLIDEVNKISNYGFLVFDDIAVMKRDISAILAQK
ncbi:hypothetical protein GCM10023310_69290 [Paenibacillus vulneris]|uniref:Uncharacterized protein n=1 Tax=Paenibacillus vulneris TaxID=1133364 RepID=A0ABW3UHA2_9BACL